MNGVETLEKANEFLRSPEEILEIEIALTRRVTELEALLKQKK